MRMNWQPVCPKCGNIEHNQSKIWTETVGCIPKHPGDPKQSVKYLGIICACGEKIPEPYT